jgi:hypothetical protein
MASLQFPTKVQPTTFFTIQIFNVVGKSYKDIATGTNVQASYTQGSTIHLPLPTSGIVDNYTLRFDDAKTAAAAAIGNIAAGAKELLANTAKTAAQATGVYDTASLHTGIAIDPNVTPLFRGIDLRTLSLQWDLIPRSKSDSQAAANIVETLRLASLPGVVGNSVSSVLTFPSAFGLSIVINGNDSLKSLPNLRSSKGDQYNWICEGFNVTYNGGAPWSQFIDGEPTMISIQMNFKEMNKQHRGVQASTGAESVLMGMMETEQTQPAPGQGLAPQTALTGQGIN